MLIIEIVGAEYVIHDPDAQPQLQESGTVWYLRNERYGPIAVAQKQRRMMPDLLNGFCAI